MATIVYPQGEATVTVPANEKIAVFSYSSVQIYQRVGYPNFPDSWDLIETTDDGEQYVSSAFAAGATLRVSPSASPAFYEVGSAPVVTEPQADITAADATFTISGLAAAQGGYVRSVGGTSSTSGNAGGAAEMLGGQPGATGVGGAATVTGGAGGATSGKGGAVLATGGAGTAGNASGGSVILQPGAKHGSGLDGGTFNRGTIQFRKQGAPATSADTATLTAAQMVSGILAATPTAAATYTTATGTDLKAALPTDLAAGDSFDLTIINLGGSGDDITLQGGADVTFVGSLVVTVAAPSSGTFRFRWTTGTTFIGYRL